VNAVAATLIDWLASHTYPIVFVGTLIDASGLPFPGRLLLIAAGAVAGTGRRNLAVIILVGAVAAMMMDTLWYAAGVRGSGRLLALFRKLTGTRAGDEPAVDYFARYGIATIVLGRFFTSLRLFAWPAAAARGLGYRRFVLFDVVAAVLWTSTWVLIGWAVGARWRSAAESAGMWVTAGGAIVVAIALGPLAMRFWRRRARRRSTSHAKRS
jgi:membrane protein DedA with SNARE-associated domain